MVQFARVKPRALNSGGSRRPGHVCRNRIALRAAAPAPLGAVHAARAEAPPAPAAQRGPPMRQSNVLSGAPCVIRRGEREVKDTSI